MGRIKGWKLKGHYKNGVSEWKSRNTRRTINLFDKGEYWRGGKEVHYIVAISNKKGTFEKSKSNKFPTKKKAMSFASNYMKKHPKA